MDYIVVPVGGAGLIAGISLATKTLQPEVKVRYSQMTYNWGISLITSLFHICMQVMYEYIFCFNIFFEIFSK